MQQAPKGGGTQGENGYRQRKRTRAEEPIGSSAPKASKFRRSNASSSAIGSNTSEVNVISRSTFRVESNIRAKQTQLFGSRIYHPPTTTTVVPKKGRRIETQKVAGNHQTQIQTTLSDSLHIKDKTNVKLNNNPQGKGSLKDFQADSDKENELSLKGSPVSISNVDANMGEVNSSKTKELTPITPAAKPIGTLDITVSTTAGTEDSNAQESKTSIGELNSIIILACDRELLSSRITATSLRYDVASYGQDWILHHRDREEMFQPWQMALSGKVEKLRLAVIESYWESMKARNTTPATIFIAINNFGRLLNCWNKDELEHPSSSRWALTALVAYRLAFKTEERPDVLWEVTSFWSVFPMFNDWDIDRSDQNVNKSESDALRLLDDSMDVPLAPMFLALYVTAAGWPRELIPEYHELGLYLVSLATFASIKDTLLRNVVPSKLAAAALALAVKIVNGDRGSGVGIVKHLPGCRLATNFDNEEPNTAGGCICRYEFWPSRLEVYSGLTFEELKPVVRGLSALLRSRSQETAVLRNYFPLWGDNDWQ